MEHRWGHRIPVGSKVRLLGLPGAIGFGSLQNVSSSGAYMQTNLRLPPLSCVTVGMSADPADGGDSCEIPAQVVRCDDTGLGLEWEEFAPRAIRRLLNSALPHEEIFASAVHARVISLAP